MVFHFSSVLQQQLDVPIPRYFLKERLEVIRGREKILARILAECGLNLPDVVCIVLKSVHHHFCKLLTMPLCKKLYFQLEEGTSLPCLLSEV